MDEGLRSFKRHLAGEETLTAYSIPADGPEQAKSKNGNNAMLTRVIQKSPSWVCRAVGESLYGHMG